VLAQTNHGESHQLMVAGVSVGLEFPDSLGVSRGIRRYAEREKWNKSSIIMVLGTDAPLLPHQLKRIARRASLGLARTGAISANGSGDIFLAFSTANSGSALKTSEYTAAMLPNRDMDYLFEATVEATEEAIINSLIAAETMTGFSGTVNALPQDLLIESLRKQGRLKL
jgi:D-aminopeptidase